MIKYRIVHQGNQRFEAQYRNENWWTVFFNYPWINLSTMSNSVQAKAEIDRHNYENTAKKPIEYYEPQTITPILK